MNAPDKLESEVNGNDSEEKPINEWTIMFYFAADNELAPLIVSQLKGLKDAGYQRDAEVVVRFDPKEKGAPTRVYNVNAARKRAKRDDEKTKIGESSSFIRNLLEDDVQMSAPRGARSTMNQVNGEDLMSEAGLKGFLEYCAEKHRARHYMLFLVGHGMIVGNDAFLPDERPVSAIGLKGLGKILKNFAGYAGGTMELLAMHSCSMSGIEVAYELQGTASYMMASEGTSFVGSWPYRQLMMRTFTAIRDKEAESSEGIGILIEKLYGLSFYNARDFWLGGYSTELTLCSLKPEKFKGLTKSLQELVVSLKEGVDPQRANDGERAQELILLAHLKSQSYWGESYTDLYDFCKCLWEKCDNSIANAKKATPDQDGGEQPEGGLLKRIMTACEKVMKKLSPVDSPDPLKRLDALVIHSRHLGWKYQYSHGLSIYFPWGEPADDKDILVRYQKYIFTKDLLDDSWLSFLKVYFEKTRRLPEKGALPEARDQEDPLIDVDQEGVSNAASAGVGINAFPNGLVGALEIGGGEGTDKVSGSTGAACNCPSIKNYPMQQA